MHYFKKSVKSLTEIIFPAIITSNNYYEMSQAGANRRVFKKKNYTSKTHLFSS